MNRAVPVLLAAGGLLMLSRSGRRRRGTRSASSSASTTTHGLGIVEGKLTVRNWNTWLRFAPQAIQRAVSEGAQSPDEIAGRVFYRMFPARDWPPSPVSPLFPMWQKVVELLHQTAGEKLRPEAIRQGLRVIK